MTVSGTALKVSINGTLVWSGTDTEFSTGRVGIGMYRDSSSTGNRLDVDWATLTTAVADEVGLNPWSLAKNCLAVTILATRKTGVHLTLSESDSKKKEWTGKTSPIFLLRYICQYLLFKMW